MKPRWQIKGRFTTTTPLHVGSGDITNRSELVYKEGDRVEACDVAAVVVDRTGKPCIPGTTIKGVLRAWADRFCAGDPRIDRIFGPRDITASAAEAGWAEFCTAFVEPAPSQASLDGFAKFLPYWCAGRLTGVLSHVCIDRFSGTAADDRLFYEEFVPEGVSFSVEIDATRLAEDEIGFLLGILEKGSAHETHPFQFGANGADGWGRVRWELDSVKTCDTAPPGSPVAFACCTPMSPAPVANLTVSQPPHLRIDLSLEFQGPFLVNDASRAKEPKVDDGRTNFTVLRRPSVTGDDRGCVWLPTSSFRGALRQRAEFLLRSLDERATGDPDGKPGNGPIERIFGHTARCARLRIEEFTNVGECATPKQDFVAIDRFTGGAAEGAKFDATYADRPQLKTTLVVDLEGLRGYDVRLMPPSVMPKSGKRVIVLASVGDALLLRVFDADGNQVVDTDDSGRSELAGRTGTLRNELERLWGASELTAQEKTRVIAEVRSVLRYSGVLPGDLALLLAAIRDVCTGKVTIGFGGSKGYGEARGTITRLSSHEPNSLLAPPVALQEGKIDESVEAWLGSSLAGLKRSPSGAPPRLVPGVITTAPAQPAEPAAAPPTVITGKLVYQETKEGRKRRIIYLKKSGDWTTVPLPFEDVHLAPSLKKRTEEQIEIDFEWLSANKPHRIRPSGEPWAASATSPGGGAAPSVRGRFAHPYYFLPLKDRTEFRDGNLGDRQPVGHERYLAARYSGTLRVKLITKTPLLVCDDGRDVEPAGHREYGMRLGGEMPLLASSSVRGMLRSAYEAVTNSRFGVFPGKPALGSDPAEDHGRRLGFRLPANQSLTTVPVRIVARTDGRLAAQALPGTSQIQANGGLTPGDPLCAAWCQHYGQAHWRPAGLNNFPHRSEGWAYPPL